MLLKYLIIILLFFILTILQISFFPYVSLFGATPNLTFVLFFILIFFEGPYHDTVGFFATVVAGIFLDATSPFPFGVSIVALLIIYLFHKIVRYFFQESQNKYLIFYFILMGSIYFVLYHVLLYGASILFYFPFNVRWYLVMGVLYNLIFALIGFYMYKIFVKQDKDENQLKLF